MSKIDLLLVEPLPAPILEMLEERFTLHHFTTIDALTPIAHTIRAIATGGGSGVKDAIMDALPNLEIISVNGVGTDAINLEKAKERHIHVTITAGLLTEDVADMAMMLTLSLRRNLLANEAHLRSGSWENNNPPLSHSLNKAKIGIAGFGHIGQAIAQRAAAFNMEVAYYNRNKKESPYHFIPNLIDLAKWSDIFVVAVSGGPQTAGMINAEILEALGQESVLINIARGSIINEADLLHALKEGKISGAGLDVFQNEPKINHDFFALKNTILQPHQASATFETRQKMGENIVHNLFAHFDNKPLITALF